MSNCQHLEFKALVNVARVLDGETEKISYFMAEIEVECAECGQKFVFEGLPRGFNPNEPTSSCFGLKANLPIHPLTEADKQPESMRYVVKRL